MHRVRKLLIVGWLPAEHQQGLREAFPELQIADCHATPERIAEEIRDAILAVSGEFDPTPAREHPFPSPITWGYTQHGPFNAVYDHNRRSVYLMTQRLKRHPFLARLDRAYAHATTAKNS